MPSSTSHRASHDRARLAAQWTGLLAGPVVWLVLLEMNYVLSYVACEMKTRWFLHLATAIAILLVAAAGLWSWSARLDNPFDAEELSPPLSEQTCILRVRWLAAAGVAFSIGFILLILATHIPALVLKTCQ